MRIIVKPGYCHGIFGSDVEKEGTIQARRGKGFIWRVWRVAMPLFLVSKGLAGQRR